MAENKNTIEIELKANIEQFMCSMDRATKAAKEFVQTFHKINTLTTYRRADGEPIYGEYDWVVNPTLFEDTEEEIEIIKEIWLLTNSETIMFGEEEDEDGND